MQFAETIYALSSGRTPSGVAVIRISGTRSRQIAQTMAGSLPMPRVASLRTIRSDDGRPLDRAIVIFFPGPGSFTGEDCLELHLHGGIAVVAAVMEAIASFETTRMAEAGEFTRRAFLNGKVDLAEAEALGDLIAAETEAQRHLALGGASGGQSRLYESWRGRIIHALAMVEAELDFADEGDVPGSVAGEVWADVADMIEEITGHIGGFRRAEIVREGFRVVIVGPPNAGKSSLLNALARREVAIVTPEAGTTRDLIDVSLDLAGIKVVLTDTAGLRDGAELVEAIGIERALSRAADADLVIDLVASDAPHVRHRKFGRDQMTVLSKTDIRVVDVPHDVAISSKTGLGMNELLGLIEGRARQAIGETPDLLPARQRHVELLGETIERLERALLTDSKLLELRAEELRLASRAIGRIAGHVGAEEVLDVVFGAFCIGK